MEARPNHEGFGPSPSSFSSRAQVGTTSSPYLNLQPATGKAKGRAMVLRRYRARRLLLRAGDDHAAAARRVAKSCHFLPWRTEHGAAEGLDRLLQTIDDFLSGARPPWNGLFYLIIFNP